MQFSKWILARESDELHLQAPNLPPGEAPEPYIAQYVLHAADKIQKFNGLNSLGTSSLSMAFTEIQKLTEKSARKQLTPEDVITLRSLLHNAEKTHEAATRYTDTIKTLLQQTKENCRDIMQSYPGGYFVRGKN